MLNFERISRLVEELQVVNVQLLRDQMGVEPHTDPRGIVRLAYGEASKRLVSAAVSLAGLTSLIAQEGQKQMRLNLAPGQGTSQTS